MSLIVPLLLLGLSASAPEERGVCLGLFSADPEYGYRPLLKEIVATGATHVSLAWVWWQDSIDGNEIKPRPGWSPPAEQIALTIREAKALGLRVTAFPIVRLAKPGPKEWRGVIRPQDEDAWWASYRSFILEATALAEANGAERLSIGSELLSREPMRARWLELIDLVRLRGPRLELMYSANWDHFQPVSFWDAVDVIGVTGYFELTQDLNASTEALTEAWDQIRPLLLEHGRRIGKPMVISEIGYPSLDGGAAWPWDETRKAPVDLEEQRRAYQAFVAAWSNTPALAGVYFWNWFGFGGPDDRNYTPRGKPAAEVLRRWYQEGKAATRPADPAR